MHISRITSVLWLFGIGLLAKEVGCKPPLPPITQPSAGESTESTGTPKKVAIEAYSGQNISRYGPIRVIFEKELIPPHQIGTPLAISPFQFSPPLHGHAIWSSTRELQFQLDTPLATNQHVEAKLRTQALSEELEPSEFTFQFWPKKLSFAIDSLGWTGTAGDSLYTGEISTTDRVEDVFAEKILTVSTSSSTAPPTIRWRHTKGGQNHQFFISNLTRTNSARQVELNLNGAPLNIEDKVTKVINIPASNILFVMVARHAADNSILLKFSDPIAPQQDFRKFISIPGKKSLRFSPSGHTLRIYASKEQTWDRSTTINITKGIRSSASPRVTSRAQKLTVRIGAKVPEVRFLGKGLIIPESEEPTIPIETINLSHIWVEAVHIPSPNLQQFLQVSNLDDDHELVRVANVVWRKHVDLQYSTKDRDRWVRRGLDLGELIKTHPSGLYRLNLYYMPRDTDGSCPNNAFVDVTDNQLIQHLTLAQKHKELSSWDPWANGMANYNQRLNPCSVSYYYPYHDHDIRAARSVLFSDIGIIAKKGQTNDIFIAATQISSTEPLVDADVSIYNFAHQTLGQSRTDNKGFAQIRLTEDNPFVATVTHKNKLGILKLSDGRALSVAHFDAGGKAVSKGIKGYIYSERGVWRPGDTIHLGFVLFDSHAALPSDHPVQLVVKNPKGQIIHKATSNSSPPIYRFDIPTAGSAPTGNYYATVRVGPVSFHHSLRVETVVPNRFKIEFNIGKDQLDGPIATLNTHLQARWLHGAIARGNDVSIDLGLTPTQTTFSKYADYTFDDPTNKFFHPPTTVFKGTLDDEGSADVHLKIHSKNPSPGMLRASFITRVFETSGQASTDRHSIRFSPYKRYIGIKTPKGDKARSMLLTDTKHRADIVAVDAHGEPVNTRVKVQLYKIKWRWWWEKGEDNLADFNTQPSHQVIASDDVTISNGQGSFEFEVKYPNWGRYLLVASDLNGEHRTGKTLYIDWPGWAGRQEKDTGGAAQRLALTTDRQTLNVGESFTISFPSPNQGRALLSLENGSKVVQTRWINFTGETTQVRIPASEDMVPNIFAHVTILQPHKNKVNDRPIRLYGITPIEVMDPKTRLEPVIKAPAETSPTTEFTVSVSEQNGRPMTYTLAVVDEGLLGLTRFKTPDPWRHFHQREALGVRTWDLYDYVAGAYSGPLETLLAIGGGAPIANKHRSTTGLRFAPVVRVLGPMSLTEDAENTHNITLPPYLGEVRVMVTAASAAAFGHAERSIRVSKPLMVLSAFPRTLSPQESVSVPVTVFVSDPTQEQVAVKMTVAGPASISKALESQIIDLHGAGEHTIQFPVVVGDKPEPVSFFISAKAGPHTHQEATTVDVRYPTLPTTRVTTKRLVPHKRWQPEIGPVGVNGTNKYTLELSKTPPLQLGRHLEWLIAYPHGCLEQTVSKAFPQLYLGQLSALSPSDEERIRTHITASISKLRSFQTSAGDFTYWPGTAHAHAWSNIWAGHFLLEARSAGYAVDEDMLQLWLNHLSEQASTWMIDDATALTQAYSLYVLTLAGRSPVAAMNRLREADPSNPWVRYRLAASYALAGETATARTLLPSQPIPKTTHRLESDIQTFGTPLRNGAMALETYLAVGDVENASRIAEKLSEKLQSAQLTTHEIGYALVALARMGLRINPNSPAPKVTVTWQGTSQQVVLSQPLNRLSLPADPTKMVKLTATNHTESPVFAYFSMTGHPPAEPSPANSHGLQLTSHMTRDSKSVPIETVEEGDDLVMYVTVKNQLNYTVNNIALAHLVPTGMVIRNDRLDGTSVDPSLFDYQDIRDQRVYTYFNLQPGQSKIIPIRVHAQLQGKFFLAPIRAEAMYDAGIYGETSSDWFELNPPGPHQ
ncbi:MAG: hypothetical protein KTR25_09900 [Myxococcales bacterium]|nr:hypothetical protein [Myxococcales bacterium]